MGKGREGLTQGYTRCGGQGGEPAHLGACAAAVPLVREPPEGRQASSPHPTPRVAIAQLCPQIPSKENPPEAHWAGHLFTGPQFAHL